ncbi:hypothetical protein [Sphingomonas psychrolutea]|nr:hypothetical protein [Sphingomonas psychrolutea]
MKYGSHLATITLALGFGALGVKPVAAVAQPADASACSGAANAVCVTQVGDRNVATIALNGNTAGGVIAGVETGNLTEIGSSRSTGPISISSQIAGSVSQSGNNNHVSIAMNGDNTAFAVSQQGNFNSATQSVEGLNNSLTLRQSSSDPAIGNTAIQVQLGNGNSSFASQTGSGNTARLIQSPTAEATLLGIGALLDPVNRTSESNAIVLEQTGPNNQADLGQQGNSHSIALRQNGYAQILITQSGVGRSISVDQPVGSVGVQITQY